MAKTSRKKRPAPSPETQAAAEQIAKGTQRPGQTKEQTRLIQQGIQKGIEEYKKQQRAKARAADKAKKQQAQLNNTVAPTPTEQAPPTIVKSSPLPWWLLLLSWLGFGLYIWFTQL
ncbi:MAG: DUF2956 family protein [Aeromonadales bacterium]|nr:DUF2956 family protein [Aeromonadales bacterium]